MIIFTVAVTKRTNWQYHKIPESGRKNPRICKKDVGMPGFRDPGLISKLTIQQIVVRLYCFQLHTTKKSHLLNLKLLNINEYIISSQKYTTQL